ncbi:UDP-N-acetylmuramoyl-tripeptide--D-alanyl-D-alanine ligase [Rhodobaculum claviforme]|uniref:UDP-N-acetylmuramoyl-tripeptide--D-alanyl-D-alanine ligase n=1 Tax=Rhodobaculum claviforme TaxID=1549854 RepID=A0A934TJH4_9RHOB|nr:UDP-N-acetylmuramoyl-tripeptide--D-alanyl-D-alanine ligase [Rhodobaculum claviforme]MBK5926646.1 UDP-N-acetylmuramoyl-tripeptide--D-alanyl-D-alanine ligase [Rhodobaculum claviforme]
MSLWTATDAAAATGGRAQGNWAATGVSIDTRTLAPGDLFVALTAARDGHDFVADALAAGAAAAMVSRVPARVAPDAPLLVVADVFAALQALGAAARARMGGRVIAVTGSVGKTSTKDMLRVMLARQGAVHAAEASLNNHWGVPLTLARMPAATDFAVVEIGMNAPGEIAPLARLARPHVALITTIAPAHLERLGSLEGIAEEKAAIFEGLEPGGVAVWPEGLTTSDLLRARAAGHDSRPFGPGTAHNLGAVHTTPEATVAEAVMDGAPVLLKLPGAGRHFAMNALGALVAATAAGADLALAALDLAGWMPPGGRGARRRVVLDAQLEQGFEVIDDAYNANPASVGAALDMLAEAVPAPRGRRIAILGDMLELGADEAALHAALAGHPAMARIDTVHTAGARMAHLWHALPPARRGVQAADAGALAAAAGDLARPGDILLVKGSKASGVARIVDALANLGQAARHTSSGT